MSTNKDQIVYARFAANVTDLQFLLLLQVASYRSPVGRTVVNDPSTTLTKVK